MAILIQEECVSCAMCADICPEKCISEEDEQFVVDLERCTQCAECLPICPVDCIVAY